MAQTAECRKCGDYIYAGYVLCDSCTDNRIRELEQENARQAADIAGYSNMLLESQIAFERVGHENAKLCAELETQRTSKRGQPPEEG